MSGTLVPEFTFETFRLGPHNRWAHSVGVAVAETPGMVYNPLFIYGGPGSGKTRLLHAIGNLARELHPSLDVRYLRAADFGGESATSAGQQDDFRSRCLDAGMLLVDDVQLLPDTGAGQPEFLGVFTALHSGGRQLVISSDRAPRSLAGLDDSLRDRLEWGLVAEITGTNDTAAAQLPAQSRGSAPAGKATARANLICYSTSCPFCQLSAHNHIAARPWLPGPEPRERDRRSRWCPRCP